MARLGLAGATVAGNCESRMTPWGRSVGVAGRVVRKTQAAGVERKSDECPAPAARAGSGAACLPPLQARAEVGGKLLVLYIIP